MPNLALVIGSCLVTVMVAEVAVRILRPLSTLVFRVDADLGYRLAPNQISRSVSRDFNVEIRTNSEGFHDVDHDVVKPSDVYRIVVLGDSFVEGLQLETDEGFTRQLEQRITGWRRDKRLEVINLGISGTGPAQHYRTLELYGLRYQPDLVLMALLPDNDFRDSYQPLSGAISKPFYRINRDDSLSLVLPQVSKGTAEARFALQRSALLQLVRKVLANIPLEGWLGTMGLLSPQGGVDAGTSGLRIPSDWFVYMADPPAPWPDAYRVTLRMIEESARLANRHHAKFLAMIIGSTATIEGRWAEALAPYPDAARVRWEYDRPERVIEDVGRRAGFEVVNLVDSFRSDYRAHRRSHSWAHDGHWNAAGHRLAADIMSGVLQRQRAAYGLD